MAWSSHAPGPSMYLILLAFAVTQLQLPADATPRCQQEEDAQLIGQEYDEDLQDLQLLQLGLTLHRGGSDSNSTDTLASIPVDPSLPLQLKHQTVTAEDLEKAHEESLKMQNPLIRGMLRNAVSADLGADPNALEPTQRAPMNAAEWLSFVDEDPRKGIVKGTIRLGPAYNQSDVTHYNLFWASNGIAIGDLIASLPTGIEEYDLHSGTSKEKSTKLYSGIWHRRTKSDDGVALPAKANQLIVFTSNRAGMSAKGVTTDVYDWWQPPLDKLLKNLPHIR